MGWKSLSILTFLEAYPIRIIILVKCPTPVTLFRDHTDTVDIFFFLSFCFNFPFQMVSCVAQLGRLNTFFFSLYLKRLDVSLMEARVF